MRVGDIPPRDRVQGKVEGQKILRDANWALSFPLYYKCIAATQQEEGVRGCSQAVLLPRRV